MPVLQPKPNEFRPGQPQLSAEALNTIVRTVVRQIQGGGDTDVSYYGDRVVVDSKSLNPQLPAPTNYFQTFTVVQELDDCLQCVATPQPFVDNAWVPKPYSPTVDTNNSTIVYVAKPYLLQRAPWDGRTARFNGTVYNFAYAGEPVGTRTCVMLGPPTTSITQTITPSYLTGDTIIAVRKVSGITGPDEIPVTWEDINAGGRSWGGGSSSQMGSAWKLYGFTGSGYQSGSGNPVYMPFLFLNQQPTPPFMPWPVTSPGYDTGFDTDSYNNASSIKIPKSGYYHFGMTYHAYIPNGSSGSDGYGLLFVRNNETISSSVFQDSQIITNLPIVRYAGSTSAYFNAGDILTAYAYYNEAGGVIGGSFYTGDFWGFNIGSRSGSQ